MRTTVLRFAAAVLFALLLIPAEAQDGAKPRRVGLLFSGSLSDPVIKRCWDALADGLRGRGWEERRNVILEGRFAGPDPARFPELAAELLALKVEVIVAGNNQSIEAARRMTATIPIVMATSADPVSSGFVASLAHPGRNVTGLGNQLETVGGKNIELLKGIKPELERVGIIYSPDDLGSLTALKYQQVHMAPRLGLVVVPIPVSKPADRDAAFATIVQERLQALHAHPTPVVIGQRAKIAAFAMENRLATVSSLSLMTRAGFLMSYGPDVVASWRRAASFVDRILKGADPAELPVEQAERFELVVNVKTARELGLTIPPSILLRADGVIE